MTDNIKTIRDALAVMIDCDGPESYGIAYESAITALRDLEQERDALKQELNDERNRGLALLADAKCWQKELSKCEADTFHTAAERASLEATLEQIRQWLLGGATIEANGGRVLELMDDGSIYGGMRVSFNTRLTAAGAKEQA